MAVGLVEARKFDARQLGSMQASLLDPNWTHVPMKAP
jgi:hypothetical protein